MARPRKTAPLEAGERVEALSPQVVLDLLEKEYGPVQRRRRYDPVSEVVLTILSQHTSDVNAHRAYQRLVEAFGSWEAVAGGEVERIAECIHSAGLARIKAPRIKAVLNRILELRGALDLSFLGGYAPGGGEGLAEGPPRHRAKVGGGGPVLLPGYAGDARGHPCVPGGKAPGPPQPQHHGGAGPPPP
jgi:hypothetical protein